MKNEGSAATTTTTPLLASEEEPPTSLSSPTSMAHHHQQFSFDDEDAAPNSSADFSRLIQRASRSSVSAHHSELATRYHDSVYSHHQQQHSSYPHDDPTLGSWFLRGGRESATTQEEERGTSQYLFIITAGTLFILYAGLTLSSFAANVWTETWIQVQVPTILPPQWIPLGTSNLSSLLHQLNASSYRSAAVLLWITTLLIPCCFIVVVPSQILYGNEYFQNSSTKSKSDTKLRRFLELSMRWTLAVVWMEAILTYWGPHLVQLEWTRTSLSLHTILGPGLACYTVGCLCALLLTVVLRSAGPRHHGEMIRTAGSHQTIATSEPPRMSRSIRTPPPHAFRHFRLPNTSSEDGDDDDDGKTSPLLQILEETPPISRLIRTSTVTSQPPSSDPPTKPLSFLQLLLVFQVGLLSILCIVPTLVLPAVILKISGVASEFTQHRTRTIFLHQLPRTLLHTTTPTTASWWLGWLLLVPTIVIPSVATAVAVRTWTHASPHQRAVGRRWLYQWHPTVSGGVAAVAIVVALHVLESWNVWNGNHSNPDLSLCYGAFKVKDTNAPALEDKETCWKVTVQSLMGLWFWVLQSILLEAFIFLTLAWS